MTALHNRLLTTLSALALLAAATPARADAVQDILIQPAMSVTEPGRRSDPQLDAIVTTVQTTQPKAAPVQIQTQPQPAAVKPAAQTVTAAAVTPSAEPKSVPVTPVPVQAAPVETPVQPAAMQPTPQSRGDLTQILASAYTDSPALRAERETLRQQYENVALAESNRRPVVTADGGIAWVGSDSTPGGRDNLFGRDVSLNATQYLYRGGATLAEIERQLRLSDAALASYDTATQNVFLNVIAATMDIQRDRATIDLTEQNRAVIERQLQTAKRGFDVGELTRTDVAQAQARLSGADADLVASRAAFSSSIARFRQYAGGEGESLVVDVNPESLQLPATLEEAQTMGEAANPQIRTAIAAEQAAQNAIRVAQGGLLPEVAAQASAGKSWEPSALIDDVASATVGIRASVPLYEGGAARARIRQAKYSQREQSNRIADAKRAVAQSVSTAWNDYRAALSQIEARSQQVDAAEIARRGVYNEREVGTRTVIDTLDADAELLDAQVGQVEAQRNAVVAAYALMAATGQLTAEKLGLFSTAAEQQQIDAVRKKWFGTDISAAD